MKWTFSVTFEHDTVPIKTYSGTVEGGVGAAARRAVDKAKKMVDGKLYYRSVVVVLEKASKEAEC